MNRMRATSLALGFTTTIGLLGALAGCATPSEVRESSEMLDHTTAPPSTTMTVTDEGTCAAFADVPTILHNATVGLREERMAQQEYDGWLRIATRVLHSVPDSGEGAVSEALAALKEAVPRIPTGTIRPTNIDSTEWDSSTSVIAACEDAGYLVSAEGFVGG